MYCGDSFSARSDVKISNSKIDRYTWSLLDQSSSPLPELLFPLTFSMDFSLEALKLLALLRDLLKLRNRFLVGSRGP